MASVSLSFLYSSDSSIYTFSVYSYSFSINTSHPPLPTYHYFKLLPFLLLLRPLTCSIFSQATLNPAQSERKESSQKQAHPDTSDTGADTGLRIRPLPSIKRLNSERNRHVLVAVVASLDWSRSRSLEWSGRPRTHSDGHVT